MINYSLVGSYVLRKFTAGQLAGTIFLLPTKNHMVRRALKLQRTCRPLTINEPYRQACGMALEKFPAKKLSPLITAAKTQSLSKILVFEHSP